MTTAPRMIYLVVGTAAVMALTFLGTLAALLFIAPGMGLSGDAAVMFDKLLAAFVTAGMSAMSFLFGVLVNTRSAPAGTTETTASVTVTPAAPPPAA